MPIALASVRNTCLLVSKREAARLNVNARIRASKPRVAPAHYSPLGIPLILCQSVDPPAGLCVSCEAEAITGTGLVTFSDAAGKENMKGEFQREPREGLDKTSERHV